MCWFQAMTIGTKHP